MATTFTCYGNSDWGQSERRLWGVLNTTASDRSWPISAPFHADEYGVMNRG